MMDERLISEVQKHAIIYNRQKSNMINGDKSASKELAWTKIALNLGTDADSCKKRWKYLRERYVQQKKVGDSPSYEHLSRPYLEKMRFLDHFIQPRKSYRNVGHLLQSPNNSQHSMMDGGSNDESTRLVERSMQMSQMLQNFQNDHNVAAAVSEHLQQPQSHHTTNLLNQAASTVDDVYNHYYSKINVRLGLQQDANTSSPQNLVDDLHNIPPPAPPDIIKNEMTNAASSSSSIVSSHPSPAATSSHAAEILEELEGLKRRRLNSSDTSHQNNNHHNHLHHEDQSGINLINNNSNSIIHNNSNSHHHNNNNINNLSDGDAEEEQSSTNNGDPDDILRSPPFPSDFLYPFYQHAAQRQVQQVVRNSDQLLGELVTSELIKMSKDRKKMVQKKILKILFFDD